MNTTNHMRPRTLQGETYKEAVHCTDSYFVILNKEASKVKEVFSKIKEPVLEEVLCHG